MPALKWLRLLMNHIPGKYEHLVRNYGHYSNHSCGARRTAEQNNNTPTSVVKDESPAIAKREASRARLMQKICEVDLLQRTFGGVTMRIIALSNGIGILERILKHLSVWDPQPETPSPAGAVDNSFHDDMG